MIGYLSGKIIDINGQSLVLDVGGVGYLAFCTQSVLDSIELGSKLALHVHTDVQERAINLYGFVDKLEKEVFLLLVSVNGIGAKSAAEILSKVDKMSLLKMIAGHDATGLKRVKGIGPKKADRLVVELKDRVSAYVGGMQIEIVNPNNEISTQHQEALAAMKSLGFSEKQAQEAINQVKLETTGEAEAGEIVRAALAFI